MRYFLVFQVLLLSVLNSSAQSPGGIATNNTMWIRSDIGVTSAANIVSQWQEVSGANITGNFTVQPITGTVTTQTGPTVLDPGINFNPYIRFDGFTNSLSSINLFPGTSLVTNSNVTLFQVFNLKGGIVWLKWETDQVGATGRLGFENSAGNIRFDFPKAVPATAGQNVGNINVLNQHSLSTCYADAAISVNRLNGADNTTLVMTVPGDFSLVNDKIVIGNENLLNLPAQVDMAEVIIYSRTLSQVERNKIESYLAVKYGFTLNQAAANANNYTASDGTIIWDRATNSGYANNITGIGRDDASALSQKQSKSINTAALITLYNGTYAAGNFPLLNSANTNTFSTDKSFLLIGDNGLPITLDQCIFNGKGQRMQRVWKVSKIGPSLTQTYTIDQAAVPASVKNIISSTDPTFPPAATIIHPLTAANGKFYADIILNHDNYFTYATDTIIAATNINHPLCSNLTGGSVLTAISGGNPPFTYSWNPSGQVTEDLINVAGGTYTLTITQGTCQSTYPVTLNTPASPPAPVVNNVQSCPNFSVTLQVQNPNAAYTYNWYFVPTGGTIQNFGTSFVTPLITGPVTFYVEAVDGGCVSIRTPVLVTLYGPPGPPVSPVTICTGTTATLVVQNPQAGTTYNWYNVATGGVIQASSPTFTTPVLTTATTFYVESLSGSCPSLRTAVLVSISPSIIPPVVNGVTICPGTATLTIQNPNASYTYNWYATATGGTVLGTGSSFTTPALNTTTTYYAETLNSACPSARTPVIVNVIPVSSPAATSTAICPGNSTILTIQNPNGAYSYSWYASPTGGTALANGTTYTTPVVSAPTTYYVELFDGVCNSIRTPVPVNFIPPLDTPRVSATIVGSESITFSWPPVAGAAGYIVSVDGGPYISPSSGSTGLSHIVNGLENSQTGEISVIALSPPLGCGDSDPGHAKATTYGDGFYVPNAFTPNGQNPLLTPIVPGGFVLDYFTVFNRWGQKIFSTKIIGEGWNGNWSSKAQPVGTYVWICSYHYPGGRIIIEKGTFTLIR